MVEHNINLVALTVMLRVKFQSHAMQKDNLSDKR